MNELPCPDAPSNHPSQLPIRGSFGIRRLGIILLVLAAGLIGYSILVAFHEADRQETVLLGQTTLASGSPAGWRIFVRNRASGRPVPGALVTLGLSGKDHAAFQLGTFQTDAGGCLDGSIDLPEIPPGPYQLTVDAVSRLGRDQIIRTIDVQRPARILLSSDKPLYQPGQTIHLRSLLLNPRTQKPLTNETVLFEISDPKGNKVFKEAHPVSSFGITAADFVLASELNLGRYAIRAMAGSVTCERNVEVKRYVLPKFKVSIVTDKTYYLPGQTVSGLVRGHSLFGKPVSGGAVRLRASTFHEKPVDIIALEGSANAAGEYSFRFELPDSFVGLPQKNENAMLDLTAEIQDSGGHTERNTLSLSVARTELEVTAIPEGGTLVPGVENLLYVLATYPDGRPARCTVFLDGTAYQTDAQGVATVKISAEHHGGAMNLLAVDGAGKKAALAYQSGKSGEASPLLLRTDRAIYEAGQAARLTLLSPGEDRVVFLDVIKDGQTVLTKTVVTRNHTASYSLPLPAALVGTLEIHAYTINSKGEDRGLSRIVYVNPASGLRISADPSKPVFRPGEVAKLDFQVTDSQGRPTPAALGIRVVDEAVFALHESRPGLLREFIEAESELMKPRYQIKSFAPMESRLLDPANDQALAQAYFASLSHVSLPLGVESLANGPYLRPGTLEHVRSLRGTPAYESLRKDPQYASLLRRIEGETANFRLHEVTGPEKVRAAEAYRKTYFRRLATGCVATLCALIFVLPIGLIAYAARWEAVVPTDSSRSIDQAEYVTVSGSSASLLSVASLCPLMFYPYGFLLLSLAGTPHPGRVLVLSEVGIIICTLLWQWRRINTTRAPGFKHELSMVRIFVAGYLLQFLVSRGGFLHLAYGGNFDGLGFFWFLGSLIAPFAISGHFATHLRSRWDSLGISQKLVRYSPVEWVVAVIALFFLGGMLLPSLAKARSTSMRGSLINDLRQIDAANEMTELEHGKPGESGSKLAASPRVRRDFPETLFWQPSLITDDTGHASVEIPVADSITTWRASVEGVSAAGKLGSMEIPLTVFQDFFVDLDLPAAMSLHDEISAPVTCYNYLQEPQTVNLSLPRADWFHCSTESLPVQLGPNEVKTVRFPIKVLQAGTHSLRITATGSKLADAIEREIRILPTGTEVKHARSEILKKGLTDVFEIPSWAVPNSPSLQVKLYPSRFSEVVEGLDSILKAPYGCFEQTSSTTYPNVLVLDYLKRTGRLTPEIEIKARKFINAGYQRLLTFEVAGGGFEWFGHAPANVCLTAYGILEFTDMARVHPVDEAVIRRSRQWLFSLQNSDGSWDELHRGWTWAGRGSITAFVAWALAESGDESAGLDKALNYLHTHPDELSNTYAKALAANAFLARHRHDSFGLKLATELKKSAVVDSNSAAVHWISVGRIVTYSRDFGMTSESPALATMALLKASSWPDSVKRGLTWISTHKFADGTSGSTQATILAMRALLEGTSASLGQNFDSVITLLLNGEVAETFQVNRENSDVMRLADLSNRLRPGKNQIELRQVPAGEIPVQLCGAYWQPARSPARGPLHPRNAEPLSIDLDYDRTTLAVNDELRCRVHVQNNSGAAISMAMIDLGIPPGFTVEATPFASMRERGEIVKFELTGSQIILYLRELSSAAPLRFEYALRAKYPLRVQSPRGAVYEYYQPQNRAESTTQMLSVND